MTSAPSTVSKPPSTSAFQALRNRNYRLYWFSGLGTTGAQGIQQLALAWLVLDLTDSAGQLGLVFFMQGISMAAMALFGGVLVDRYNRKNLLMLSQFLILANLLVIALLTIGEMVAVWHIYLSAIGLGTMQSITMPARQALISSIVPREDAMNAVSLNMIQMHSSRIVWPTVAGAVIATSGVGVTLLICTLASLAGVLLLYPVRTTEETAATSQRTTSAGREIMEGLRYTFAHPLIGRVMTLALAISAFGLAFMSLGPGFARQELDFGASTTGLFLMAGGIGSLVGAVAMLMFRVEASFRIFVMASAGFAFSLFCLCANLYAPAAFVFSVAFGFCMSCLSFAAQTILQVESEPRLLGRVISLWSFAGGLAAITALPIGVAGDLLGLRVAFGFVSVILLLLCVVIGFGAQPLRWLGARSLPVPERPEGLEAEAAS